MKELEEGSEACKNYFIRDSNENKTYLIHNVSTDESSVLFSGVDIRDPTITNQTLLYDYDKIKVTKAELDAEGRSIITIDEELRVTSGELPFIVDTYEALNQRIEVVLDGESYYVTGVNTYSGDTPYLIVLWLLRKKDGRVKDFTSLRNMLWVRDGENNRKFTATEDVL
jgi:hypothetical protein